MLTMGKHSITLKQENRIIVMEKKKLEEGQDKKPLIVYLHGFGSSGQSGTVKHLRSLMPEYEVLAPDIPVNPADALP